MNETSSSPLASHWSSAGERRAVMCPSKNASVEICWLNVLNSFTSRKDRFPPQFGEAKIVVEMAGRDSPTPPV